MYKRSPGPSEDVENQGLSGDVKKTMDLCPRIYFSRKGVVEFQRIVSRCYCINSKKYLLTFAKKWNYSLSPFDRQCLSVPFYQRLFSRFMV